MIIYAVTNKVNGKVYIGLTTRTLHERKREHVNDSLTRPSKMCLHNAIRKYGADVFNWEVVDKADSLDDLGIKEQHWINHFKSDDRTYGYNSQSGGIQTFKHSKEVRQKISDAGRMPCSMSTKAKISKANKGQIPWAKGRRFTLEHKQKIAMSQKNLKINIRIAKLIKIMLKQNTKCTEIAKCFSIPAYIVYNIKHGKSWRHVTI